MSMPIQARLRVCAASIVVPHACERVHNDFVFVAGGFNHTFVKGARFLCWVAETFIGRWSNGLDLPPIIRMLPQRIQLLYSEITLLSFISNIMLKPCFCAFSIFLSNIII